ncbi:hypothetical protein N7451_009986 [Penicillium sp. IBT 35674x]|nr:hypothetical protein N7451_009986 [Penicillium sp. IBT 35674x]
MGFQASIYPEASLPFDHWNEQELSWATGAYPVEPTFGSFIFEPDCRLDHQPTTSHALVTDPSFNLQDESHTSATSSLPSQPPLPLSSCPPSLVDSHWDTSWDAVISATENEKQGANGTVDWNPNNYDLRKRLLKLNLEMIDDLELLERGSDILQPSTFLGDDTSSSAAKLGIPVFRMLNHSTQFLEILQSGIGASEDPLHLVPSIESSNGETNIFEYLKPFSQGVEQISESTATSYDSDHHTSNPALSDQTGDILPSACDVSTSMGMLTAYCHLIRVYRAIFNQLYQLFLLVPPADAAAFLLLPSSQHGQFHMEGNLTVRVQVFIDLSTNMLAKIERALGMSCSETDGGMGPVASVLASGPLTSVRDHIITQEQIECGIPLKETISCLRKLVSDPVCV